MSSLSSSLSQRSQQALLRLARHGNGEHISSESSLQQYSTSSTKYNPRLPLNRRAAVLVLLYKDGAKGELRVVVTMRGAGMRAYASQAALPGGHADTLDETPITTARREAFEEIGLPLPPSSTNPALQNKQNLPYPLTITHLCSLRPYLAKTALSVQPCIAFLGRKEDVASFMPANSKSRSASERDSHIIRANAQAKAGEGGEPDIEQLLTPQLDATEVAAVFSAPLSGFLSATEPPTSSAISTPDPSPTPASTSATTTQTQPFYKATPFEWHPTRKFMHTFHIPTAGQRVHLSPSIQSPSTSSPPASAQQAKQPPSHYRIHGLTAQILIDVARLAYDREPEFPHIPNYGDEGLIEELIGEEGRGRFARVRGKGEEFRDRVGDRVCDWLADVGGNEDQNRGEEGKVARAGKL